VRLRIRKGRFRSHVNGMTSDGQNSVAAIVCMYKGVFLKCAEILPTRLWHNVED
jgi:hypothetical protein